MTVLNHNPVYGTNQKTFTASVDSANAVAASDLGDAPTNTVLLVTAPAGGMPITRLTAVQRQPGTTTASQCNVYISKNAGAVKKFLRSRVAAAYTFAVGTAPAEVDFGYTESSPLRLEAGDQIYAQARNATAVVGLIQFTAEGNELVPDA